MEKIKLFIADANPEHIERVRHALAQSESLRIAGTSCDGRSALRQIVRLNPDALLTDIQLPGLDGISLLKELRYMKRPPVCIVCTRFYSDLCLEQARRCGASYFLYKPIHYDRLDEIVTECYLSCAESTRQKPPTTGFSQEVTHHLITRLGIPSRLSGASYIVDAAACLSEDSRLLKNLSGGLYGMIAQRNHTNSACVERAIRNALKVGCERGSLSGTFGFQPTNKEFLMYVMRSLSENSSAD